MANIVTLQQVKTYLRYPAGEISGPSADDTALQWFIEAADQVIQAECDAILPKLYDEMYDGGEVMVFLRHYPVLSVENVEEGWGYLNYELDYVEVNSPSPTFSMFAYSIDSYEHGEISRRTAGNVTIPFRPGDKNIHVVYRVGLEDVPGNIILAELELIRYWWSNSQYRAVALAGANVQYDQALGGSYTRDTATGLENAFLGIPVGMLEMIKGVHHRPKFA